MRLTVNPPDLREKPRRSVISNAKRQLFRSSYYRFGSSGLGDQRPLTGSEASLTAFRQRIRRQEGRFVTRMCISQLCGHTLTHAFFRRMVMIRFNRNFTAEEMDMHLPAKLSAELAGIFAVAVQGLKSLRERGRFAVPASSQAAADQYREDSDYLQMFVEEALVRCVEKGMRPAALYKLYTSWASAYGIKVGNNIVLGKRLQQMGFEKTRSNGKDYWCVKMTPAGGAGKRSLPSGLRVLLILPPRRLRKGLQMMRSGMIRSGSPRKRSSPKGSPPCFGGLFLAWKACFYRYLISIKYSSEAHVLRACKSSGGCFEIVF